MSCPDLAQLERFVRRELDDSSSDSIEDHVSSCAACREQVAALRANPALGEEIQAAVDATLTDDLAMPGPGAPDKGRGGRPPALPHDSFTGYKIVREIHRGGQGVVYQAFQKSTKRKVAIKVMKEGPFASTAEKARFEREIQVLGQLKHPHIITVYDSGTASGQHYFVMDYISGQPLDVYMAGREHSIEETLDLFARICDAINAAHLRGVIHRDLKPGNIRIDENDEPHILDFGLAKVAAGDREASMMTVTGQFLGSLPWASPEQAEAVPSKIDMRTDVYSLGVILYHMLTSGFPYEVIGNMRDVLDRIMKAEPARPSTIRRQINDEVETIVLKCLSKERDRRYQSAGELGRDVQRYLAGEPIEAKRDSGWYVLRKHLARYRVPVATAAAFVLLLIVATATSTVFYFRAEEQRTQAHEAAIRESEQRRVADAEAARADKEQAVAEAVRGANREAYELIEIFVNVLSRGVARVHSRDVADELRKIEQFFPEEPEPRAAMYHLLGEALHHLGYNDEAAERYRSAIALRKSALGVGHRFTLETMRDLAVALRRTGELDEAEEVLRDAVKIARRELGNEDRVTLVLMENLAELYYDQGRYAEAEPLLIESTNALLRNYKIREDRKTEAIHSLVDLYEAWHAAEPDKGYDAKANERRAQLIRSLRKYMEYLRQEAESPETTATALNNYAWELLTIEPADLRDPPAALSIALRANDMTDNENPAYLDTLALAQHLTGDTPAAIETQKKALSLLPPDAPGRGDYAAALAKFEATLEEAGTAEEQGGG